jgi:hypothetical protein
MRIWLRSTCKMPLRRSREFSADFVQTLWRLCPDQSAETLMKPSCQPAIGDSKSSSGNRVWVRFPPPAQTLTSLFANRSNSSVQDLCRLSPHRPQPSPMTNRAKRFPPFTRARAELPLATMDKRADAAAVTGESGLIERHAGAAAVVAQSGRFAGSIGVAHGLYCRCAKSKAVSPAPFRSWTFAAVVGGPRTFLGSLLAPDLLQALEREAV